MSRNKMSLSLSYKKGPKLETDKTNPKELLEAIK
jgi:hypothetical protein